MKKMNLIMLNLQLFADVQVTTQDSLSAEMKMFYDMTLLDEAGPKLIHDQFGQKRDIPKNNGKTISFRKFSSLPKATQPLTEGVTPSGKSLTVTEKTATVQQYGDFIQQSDMLEMTAVDNTIVEATKILGNQAGLTLDTVTRNAMHTGTNVTYCPKIGANGAETVVTSRNALDDTCVLTVDVVKQVVAKLRAQNTPTINGDYIAIIHPYAAYDLMSDKKWEEAHKYTTPENIYEGEIGRIAGVRFCETSEAKIYNATGDETYTGGVFGTLIFGDNAYGTTSVDGGGLQVIVKQKGSAGTADPLDQRSSVGWKAVKTAELLIDSYIVRVESRSKKFSTGLKAN